VGGGEGLGHHEADDEADAGRYDEKAPSPVHHHAISDRLAE
jgi:hypothetical protein